MKNTPIFILAMAASLSALAAYPDAAAARKAAAEFNAKKQVVMEAWFDTDGAPMQMNEMFINSSRTLQMLLAAIEILPTLKYDLIA